MYLQKVTAILYVTVNLVINDVRSLEVTRGDTATIVCGIAGTFVSPSWDDGTSSTFYIAEGQSSFNPSTTDILRWSRSSDTKNLIISSIEDAEAGTYRCSITTPAANSSSTTLTITNPTAGLDGTCSITAPIIECSTENAECSATNKCECKTGYEPNGAATECRPTTTAIASTETTTTTTTHTTTTTTTSPPTTSSTTTTTTASTNTTTTSTITTPPTTSSTTTTTTASTTTSSTTTSASPALTSTTTNNDNQKSERTIIILVSSTVGGVVLCGLLAFLGLFLYRSRTFGTAKHKHGHKTKSSRQAPSSSYFYGGPQGHNTYSMYQSYDRNRNMAPRNHRSTDEHKPIAHRQGGMPNHKSAYNSYYSVYPAMSYPENPQGFRSGRFLPHEYHMKEQRLRPATSSRVHLATYYPSGRFDNDKRSKEYADSWDMY